MQLFSILIILFLFTFRNYSISIFFCLVIFKEITYWFNVPFFQIFSFEYIKIGIPIFSNTQKETSTTTFFYNFIIIDQSTQSTIIFDIKYFRIRIQKSKTRKQSIKRTLKTSKVSLQLCNVILRLGHFHALAKPSVYVMSAKIDRFRDLAAIYGQDRADDGSKLTLAVLEPRTRSKKGVRVMEIEKAFEARWRGSVWQSADRLFSWCRIDRFFV